MNYKPTYTRRVIVPEHLDYPLTVINNMEDDEFEKYAETLRIHFLKLYDKYNFPIGTKGKNFDDIIKDLRKFNEYHVNGILTSDIYGNKNIIRYFNKWASAINHWFPEMYDTKISSTKTSIIQQLREPKTFLKNFHGIVKKDQFKFRRNDPSSKLSECIVSGLRVINGNQPAVNFPAGIAKWLYLNFLRKDQYKGQETIKVLDQCMGWGGRLLGLLSACNHDILKDKHVELYGTDVNSTTHDRFESVVNFWKFYINPDINFKLYKSLVPAEKLLTDETIFKQLGTIDISLTSPPYFNREMYSEDSDQSYKTYPTYAQWRAGFLKNTIQNTYDLLRPGGYMCWNIADIKVSASKDPNKAYKFLEADSIKIAKQIGFKHIQTYNMLMSSMVGISRVNGNKVLGKNKVAVGDKIYKFEPIFIFKKER